MRRFDEPLDPAAEAALAVIDATLAGEAVEPEQAELAELTLILTDERPAPSEGWADALDQRVGSRFARRQPPPGSGAGPSRRRRFWLYAPGAAVGLAAAVVAVVLLTSGGGPRLATDIAAPAPKQDRATPVAPSAESATTGESATAASSSSAAPSPASTPSSASAAPSAASAPSPPTRGRQVVQSAQLSLSTRPSQVDDVAQQVFDVVSAQNGVVENSTVTASSGVSGYAQFQLSVPSSNLQQTMSALSRLHGASVVSRTDASQDITGQAGGAGRRLADARALRTSLLRQLANATTQSQVNSLKAQIRDAEASISSDLSTLRSLHRQVDNSKISVTVNAAMAPGHAGSGGGGFTIGKAAHDAGRVLVVVAGVALIALAVLVPLSLVVALGLWLAALVRRRRREQALDMM
jgi:uncharacterized membrane protein (Fun14 family)